MTDYMLSNLYIQITVWRGKSCVHTEAKFQCTGTSVSLNILFTAQHAQVHYAYQPERQIAFVLVCAAFRLDFLKGWPGVFLNNDSCFYFPHIPEIFLIALNISFWILESPHHTIQLFSKHTVLGNSFSEMNNTVLKWLQFLKLVGFGRIQENLNLRYLIPL